MASDPHTPYGALSPAALFADITYIHDTAMVQQIQRHCVAHHCVAGITYDDEYQEWVWHTLYQGRNTMLEKEIAARFRSPAMSSHTSEAGLLAEVAAHFHSNGVVVDCEVVCAVGLVDMVTRSRDAVFEVKFSLSRANLFHAVGQVLLYRQAINPDARAIIIGRQTGATSQLRPFIEQLGVELMLWSRAGGLASDER